MTIEKEIIFCNLYNFCVGNKYCNGIKEEIFIRDGEKIEEKRCNYYRLLTRF